MTEITAHLSNYAQTPRKTRRVADTLRGKKVTDALMDIEFVNKRAAGALAKLLKSAVANAEHNFHLSKEGLRVKEVRVDKGMTLKRSMPRAFGRAAGIRKRRSHITLVLEYVA